MQRCIVQIGRIGHLSVAADHAFTVPLRIIAGDGDVDLSIGDGEPTGHIGGLLRAAQILRIQRAAARNGQVVGAKTLDGIDRAVRNLHHHPDGAIFHNNAAVDRGVVQLNVMRLLEALFTVVIAPDADPFVGRAGPFRLSRLMRVSSIL